MRDVKDVYRQALTEEYEAYRRSGREADAKHVAGVLMKHYGVDVTPEPSGGDDSDALERADEERPPEDTAKPPAKRGPGRPRKTGQG